MDTSGQAQWTTIETVLEFTDLFLYDLKLANEDQHRSWTGVGTHKIHQNLHNLHEAGADILLRVPLIPGITDTTENLNGIRTLVQQLPRVQELNLLPYNTIAPDKYRRMEKPHRLGRLQKQTPEQLSEIQSLFTDCDVRVTIG